MCFFLVFTLFSQAQVINFLPKASLNFVSYDSYLFESAPPYAEVSSVTTVFIYRIYILIHLGISDGLIRSQSGL